jgi:hypothetical protein
METELESNLFGITASSNLLAACFCILGGTWAYMFIVKVTEK